MSAAQWATPGRITTGIVSAAVVVAALASMTGSQRAQSLGVTRHGQILTAQDAGAADAVALTTVDPGTAGQVLTVSDAGLPHWAAASSGGASLPDASGVSDGAVLVQAGGAQAWVGQPTTLAAQARAEAIRRRGALAMRSSGTAGTASASATTDTTPTIMRSTSGVVVVYSPSAGGYSGHVLAQSGVWATRGWYLAPTGSAVRLNIMQGTLQTVDLAAAVGSIGWHAVAWSIPADGLTVRYSVDGGAVTTATPSSTPLTPVARSSSDTVYVATNGSGSGTQCGVAYLGLWESILADGDLVTLSASPSAGAPSLPSTPAWEWAAAAFAGTQAVTIDGVLHAITGSPQVWMP